MKDFSRQTPPPDSSPPSHGAGFRAHLQGVSLRDLLMLQHLARASGVYVVLSGERSGLLHFAHGTLFHAELTDGEAGLVGNRAAVEILSWPDGEFLTSTQRAAERATVSLSMDELIGAPDVERGTQQTTATGIRRRLSERGSGALGTQPARNPAPSPAASVALAAVATPGTALTAPRLAARPAELRGEVQVLVSPRGELVDGRGPGAEGLAARIAYVTRLAELIGQAMGSGDARGVRVRGPSGELEVRRHPDGHIAGTFGTADALDAAVPTPVPPPLPGSAAHLHADLPASRRSQSSSD